MPSFVGANLPGVPPVHYTQDALLEDLSRQMALSASRRQSRGSNGAYSGNAMRVVKPSSANNSPRNNLMQQRRRTMMNDPVYIQKTQQMLEQPYLPTPGPEVYANSYYEPIKRAARPVSWHPSSQLPQAHLQQFQQQYSMPTQESQYPFPSCFDYDTYAPTQMPPTPAAYSAYNSPVSFSPLVLPSYTTYELPQQQSYNSPCWSMSAAPVATSMPGMTQAPTPAFTTAASYTPSCPPSFVEAEAETAYSPVSWTNIPATGYSQNVTAPPTPEEPAKIQQADPVVVKHEAVSYLTPDEVKVEDEEEGDILIGLGLYDPPEKLHSGLLGASFEPTGKGLKLEDAWEPPVEEEEEDDDDAESEEE